MAGAAMPTIGTGLMLATEVFVTAPIAGEAGWRAVGETAHDHRSVRVLARQQLQGGHARARHSPGIGHERARGARAEVHHRPSSRILRATTTA